MAVVTLSSWLDLAGVPLATPGWVHEHLEDLYGTPQVVAPTTDVPYMDGAVGEGQRYGSREVDVPMLVRGAVDSDGVPHPSTLTGLQLNMDRLKSLAPPTRRRLYAIRHHLPDGSVRGAAVTGVTWTTTHRGPNDMDADLSFTIPAGLLRDEVPVVVADAASPNQRNLVVPNPGSAEQHELVLVLTGTATTVTIYNRTYDPADGTWLRFGGTLDAGVTIDTAAWTAVRGGVDTGLVEHSGHPRWLPLLQATPNTLRVVPTGGTVSVTVQHYPAYA